MKPITDLTASLTLTLALVLGLGFLASFIPTSTAGAPVDAVAADSGTTPNGGRVIGEAKAALQLQITHVRNDQGRVVVLVFDDPSAFAAYDYERAVGYAEVAAAAGTLTAHFPKLVSGPYAVAMFHDENEDYDLNMDGLYPREGYGTTGARDSNHEPTFEEASVAAGRVSVRMYYLP